MTLKDYLKITDNTFSLQFDDFWYHHTPDTNILMNTKTQEKILNLTNLLPNIPLSIQLNTPPLNKDNSQFNIWHKNDPIYVELFMSRNTIWMFTEFTRNKPKGYYTQKVYKGEGFYQSTVQYNTYTKETLNLKPPLNRTI
jgi:hypothetical protein